MSWRRHLARLRHLFDRETPNDLGNEIREHLQMEEQENLDAGMSPEEARHAALRRFGNVTLAEEKSREAWRWRWLEVLLQDSRYALRQLWRSPVFTLSATLTLAVGIGANTAIFSVVNAVVLRSLPYPEPERIVTASLINPRDPSFHSSHGVADFLAARDRQRSFSSFAAVAQGVSYFTWTGGREPVQIQGRQVTAHFFSVLGVDPDLGRGFASGADAPDHEREVVLSNSFWQRYFNSDPQAVGRAITLDGADYTIAGVMPQGFHFGQDADDLWSILQLAPAQQRPPFWLQPIGRLRPGVTQAQAQAELSTIAAEVQRQFPEGNMTAAWLEPMKETLVGQVRMPLLLLLGAVVLVLLIATVNVANLEIAQASARDREMAVRSALGASRSRIVRQMLTESVLLAVPGGIMGLLLACGGVRALRALAPDGLPRLNEVAVNGQVLLFTAAVSLLCGLLFGLAPFIGGFGSRGSEAETLRGGSQNLGEQRRRRGLRDALIVLEVSLSLVLLIGAGLLLRSFSQLASTTPGFNPQPLIAGVVILPAARYPKEQQVAAFYDQLLERVEHLPNVASAGTTLSLPPNLLNLMNPFWVPGMPTAPGTNQPMAVETTVSPGYFRTLGVSLLRGRLFDDSDRGRKDGILIINETMARRYFRDQDPVGQKIKTGDAGPKTPWETIVGVVSDVKYTGLDTAPEPTLYVPYFEQGWTSFSREMFLVVRATGDPKSLEHSLRSTVLGLDPDLPLTHVRTMNEFLSRSVAEPRFRTVLLGAFAAMALLLAAVGIFGVMSYVVSRRTQEIGVRMALGASRAQVLRMVLGEGMRVALIGTAIGLVEAFALTRLIRSWLYAVLPADPLTFVAIPSVVMIVAALACYLPARRAARVDPIITLRYE
jgi:putative ABC transport system permease protein